MMKFLGNSLSLTIWHFFLGVTSIWFFLCIVESRFEPGLTQLVIAVHTVRPTSVDLTWNSLHGNIFQLRNSAQCDVIIWTTTDSSRQVLENYSLQNHFIQIKYLKEKTKYAVFLKCHLNGTAFQSNVVDFLTGSSPPVRISPSSTSNPSNRANSIDHSVTEGSNQRGSIGGLSDTDLTKSNDTPTIYKHKLSAFSNVLDSTLGIIFAVIGGIVALVTACYVWKGWQRRQRFHRFMRHQDSSDQFDIIRQNISESS